MFYFKDKKKILSILNIFLILFILHLVAFSKDIFAKDLYVATYGDDSVTYADNDINNPWATPEKAWYNADAGDTVYFRGGTYYITSSINTKSNGNDGNAENPIIFKNYLSESVTIEDNLAGSMFKLQKNYNYVEGIHFIGHSFGGSTRIFDLAEDVNAEHFKIENCTLEIKSATSTDNVSCICVNNRSKYAIIKNCIFNGPGTSQVCGVQLFRASIYTIENNEIKNFDNGIMHKHSNALEDTDLIVRNNYIHSCGVGIRSVSNYATIENNLIVDCGILFGDDGGIGDGWVGADYNTIRHNTLYNGSITLRYETRAEDPNKGCLHNVIKDNIIMKRCDWHPYNNIDADIQSDYSLFQSGDTVIENRVSYTLNAWQSHNNSDAKSLSGTPTFVGGANPSYISGFALSDESKGKNEASDGKDMGADISQVGIQEGPGEDPLAPPPPESAAPSTPLVNCVEVVQENFGPSVIFHDEFEDSTPMSETYTEYNSHNGDCTVTDIEGFGGSPRCLMANWQQGQVDAGGLVYMFGRNPSASESHSDTDFGDIYWRFYLKTSKGWTGNPEKLTRATIIATPNWAQAMIAHIWGEGDDLLETDPATGIDSNNNLATTTYNDFNNLKWLGIRKGTTPIYSTSMSNTWHCIEGHVKLNTPENSNGLFEFWIDGNLEARRDDLNWVGSWQEYGINNIMFGNYWNGGAPQAQQRFMDNIVVSTEHIGLAPSPVNPIIYKTAFEDPDPGDIQSVFEAQVSATPDTSGIVWTGGMPGNADNLRVDMSTGSFQGALSGATSLSQATTYYARVRQADDSGKYSNWSPWKIFRTEGSGVPGAPPWLNEG